MKFLIIFLSLFYLSQETQGINILFLEIVASPSHHIWIKTLLTALAARGHNVTSVSADREVNSIPNLHYLHLDKVYEVLYDTSNADHGEDMDFMNMGQLNPFRQYYIFNSYCEQVITGCVKSKGYKELLDYPDGFKFDLIMYDHTIGPILLPFVEKFGNPPLIATTAFYGVSTAASFTGSPLTPSFVPFSFVYVDVTTFWGRITNHLVTYLDYFVKEYYLTSEIEMATRKDFPKGSSVRKIEKNTKLVLLNKNPVVDIAEPVMPNVIPVGGLQVQRTKELPKDLQEILDQAQKGAILFSLGTNAQSSHLGPSRITEILEAFRSLPEYTILWKFEADSLPVSVPSNVFIRKWLPQSDILAHRNVKLFITHCGLLSLQEATWFGVPVLGLPIFSDQFSNIKQSVKAGIGEQGNILNIDRHSFRALMEKLLRDRKYRKNARIRSEAFRDQKETPLERAVWWTEFVLRHPNMTFMRSPSLDQNFAVRHSWDVLAFFFTTILITLIVSLKLSCCVLRSCLKKNKPKKSKRE
ncbi:UDP-glucuronosyltransferase [Sergentomyia squamirostris]